MAGLPVFRFSNIYPAPYHLLSLHSTHLIKNPVSTVLGLIDIPVELDILTPGGGHLPAARHLVDLLEGVIESGT